MIISLQYIYDTFEKVLLGDQSEYIYDVFEKVLLGDQSEYTDNKDNKDNKIYVMTYNVHHNAMKNKKNVDNIAKIINGTDTWDGEHKHPGTFDFIATQESNDNWQELYNKLDKAKYDYCNSKDHHKGKAPGIDHHHITYYDRHKYNIVKDANGKLIVNPFGGNRAKHCILFENIRTKQKYLFINVHNQHNHDSHGKLHLKKELIEKITNAVKNIKVSYDNIIIAGDFNDDQRKYYSGFDIITHPNIKIKVDCRIGPPKSMSGTICDYVLSNLQLNKIFIPLSKAWLNTITHQQSDHYPVVAIYTAPSFIKLI